MNLAPFLLTGSTVTLTSGAASTNAQVSTSANQGSVQYMLYNSSANDAWVVSGAATNTGLTAVASVGGTPSPGFMLPSKALVVVSGPPNAYWATISATGSNLIYITPGDGS